MEENVYLKDFHDDTSTSESTGLSNSPDVANALIKTPDPSAVASQDAFLQYMQVLGQLGQTTSVGGANFGMLGGLANLAIGAAIGGAVGNLVGSIKNPGVPTGVGTSITSPGYSLSTSAKLMKFHTGGAVPGQGDVLTVLKGGETVRTKAQEEELQQELYKKHLENFAPMVCGGPQQTNSNQSSTQKNEQSQKPIHQQITKDDEMFILNLVADAIDRNRLGLRTKIQAV